MASGARASSIFDISQPTHAVVDSKTAVLPSGSPNTSNTFDVGYIYNIFGATNNGVEGSGDMLFSNGHPADVIDFHTAQPINLTSIAVQVGGEDNDSGGNRGITSFTFQQYTDNTYSTPEGSGHTFTNPDNATSPSYSPLTLAALISGGQYFEITFLASSNDGVRLVSLTGNGSPLPEPAFLGLLAFGSIGLLGRRRRA